MTTIAEYVANRQAFTFEPTLETSITYSATHGAYIDNTSDRLTYASIYDGFRLLAGNAGTIAVVVRPQFAGNIDTVKYLVFSQSASPSCDPIRMYHGTKRWVSIITKDGGTTKTTNPASDDSWSSDTTHTLILRWRSNYFTDITLDFSVDGTACTQVTGSHQPVPTPDWFMVGTDPYSWRQFDGYVKNLFISTHYKPDAWVEELEANSAAVMHDMDALFEIANPGDAIIPFTTQDSTGIVKLSDAARGPSFYFNSYLDDPIAEIKTVAHFHTTNSDGSNSPTEMANAYVSDGMEVAIVADHDYMTPSPGVSSLLWIPGVEEGCTYITQEQETAGEKANAHYLHLCSFHPAGNVQSTDVDVQSVIDGVGLSWLNHPNYYNATNGTGDGGYYHAGEVASLADLDGIEIYNAMLIDGGGVGVTTGDAVGMWDALLTQGFRLWGYGGDDAHGTAGTGGVWMGVFAESASETEILAALRLGRFYVTAGPILTVSSTDSVLTVGSNASATFQFIGDGATVLQTDTATTTARFVFPEDLTYVRCTVTATSGGKKAYTQPIFLGTGRGAAQTELDITAAPQIVQLTTFAGDDWTLECHWTDDGDDVDLSGTVEMDIYTAPGTASLASTEANIVSRHDGLFNLNTTNTTTSSLGQGVFYCHCRHTDSSESVRTVFYGRLIVR